ITSRLRLLAPLREASPEIPVCVVNSSPLVWRSLGMKIYIDGKYYDERNAKISVFDHGLLYGDGVFEGIRAYSGRVFKLKRHVERLFDSAKAIRLEIPASRDEVAE